MNTMLDTILDEIAQFECERGGRKPRLLRLPTWDALDLVKERADVYPTLDDVTLIDGVAIERGGTRRELVA
ncbi:MAG TPA: hypothetical protein VMV69_18825 [Pirellulales bacterium]|nr:hypothetical protein [Pirellulales bacterium]